MATLTTLPVHPRSVTVRPGPEELRSLTERMPNCRKTRHGNVNVQTRVVARSKASTFVVTDDPGRHSGLTMTRQDGERMARLQDDYIAGKDMLVVDGYIGNHPALKTPARLIIEASNANIAAMQQVLYYPLEEGDHDRFEFGQGLRALEDAHNPVQDPADAQVCPVLGQRRRERRRGVDLRADVRDRSG